MFVYNTNVATVIPLRVIECMRRPGNDFDVELFTHGNDILIPDSAEGFWILLECQTRRGPFLNVNKFTLEPHFYNTAHNTCGGVIVSYITIRSRLF